MSKPTAPSPNLSLLRVGVGASDASNMTIEQLVLAIDSSETAYMDQLWDSCYLFADLYRRKEWTIGLNSRPTHAHFVVYVQQLFPKRGYTESDLITRIDCYNTYSRLDDPEVIALIKEMGSLTKAHTAIPWVARHKDKAKQILELCIDTANVNLRPALRAKFPIRVGELPSRKARSRGGVSGESVINYLAQHDVGVIADELFVPRNTAREREVEFAWYAVVQSYLLEHTEISIDDVFGAMAEAWVDSLGPSSRATLLESAHSRWIMLMDLQHGEPDKWPFEMPGENSSRLDEAAD